MTRMLRLSLCVLCYRDRGQEIGKFCPLPQLIKLLDSQDTATLPGEPFVTRRERKDSAEIVLVFIEYAQAVAWRPGQSPNALLDAILIFVLKARFWGRAVPH